MQVAAAVLPDTPTSSATRAYDDTLRSEHVNQSSGITIAPETRWQKQWKDMQDKVLIPDPTLLMACIVIAHTISQLLRSVPSRDRCDTAARHVEQFR